MNGVFAMDSVHDPQDSQDRARSLSFTSNSVELGVLDQDDSAGTEVLMISSDFVMP